MILLYHLVLLVFRQVAHVHGYSSGAPPTVCSTMAPAHGFPGQTSPIPHTLTTSSNTYMPGDTITFTLSGTTFKGFMVQARDGTNQPVGTMIATDAANSRTLDCNGGTSNSITHTNPIGKTTMAFQWQAPGTSSGDITLYVSVVQGYSDYWIDKNLYTLSEDTGGASTVSLPLPQTSSTVSPSLTTTLIAQPTTPLIPQVSSSESILSSTSTEEKDVKSSQSPPGGSARKYNVKGGKILYDDACGSSKGCFVNCDGKECEYMITWRDVGPAVQFELYGKPGYMNSWIAVGFSSDTKMGGDSVTECVVNNGMIQIFNSENLGYYNRRLLNAPQGGLANPFASYREGVLYCSFTRQKFLPGVPELFNLDQDWNIMYAKGEALTMPAWDTKKHSELPPVSASSVDFQSFQVIGSSAKYTLVKAHGCLMILSWVLFTGVGIVAARYYKNVWSDKTFLKLKIWFQIHRACMVSAVALNVIAFVIIFIDVGGYSEIDVPGKAYLTSHPILGIIVTALCLTNPIMAFFRPGPDDSKRALFNWAHWGVGMSAYILSAITICFGFQLGKSSTPDYAVYIMIVYILHIIIFDVIFEFMDCMMKRQKKDKYVVNYINYNGSAADDNSRGSASAGILYKGTPADNKLQSLGKKVDNVEMTTQNGTDTPIPNGHYQTKEARKSQDRVKTVLLAVHVAFTGAFALVLVLVVALN